MATVPKKAFWFEKMHYHDEVERQFFDGGFKKRPKYKPAPKPKKKLQKPHYVETYDSLEFLFGSKYTNLSIELRDELSEIWENELCTQDAIIAVHMAMYKVK